MACDTLRLMQRSQPRGCRRRHALRVRGSLTTYDWRSTTGGGSGFALHGCRDDSSLMLLDEQQTDEARGRSPPLGASKRHLVGLPSPEPLLLDRVGLTLLRVLWITPCR